MEIKKFFIRLSSTFFYTGYLPFIPGTFGSIAGVILFLVIGNNFALLILVTAILLITGFLVCGQAENLLRQKDAKFIVIDEVGGMLISLLGMPYDLKIIIIAFFLFRLLDTLKPYPAGELQNLKGSIGVMADDLIAAVYTNIILQTALRLAYFKIS